MNRIAVEIGEDRFGHSLNAAVLRNNRFVTDVVSRVLKLERLRHAAGQPFALETCYLSAAQFSGLQSDPLHKESLFSTLERNYNVDLAYSDEEVDATTADPRTAELLGVPKRDALLRIRQVIYSRKGVVILYVLGLYRSDRHNLVIRRYR